MSTAEWNYDAGSHTLSYEFPRGVFLMTGTGIIPPSEFTLEDGDDVEITIDGIGSLRQPVVRLS